MRKRLLVVLGIVVAYRFLAQIPVPIAEPTQLREVISNAFASSDLGGFLNLLSGGALASLSIVLVGLSPYITASIISQLLTKAIPKLEELQRDGGEAGRRKINQWTRVITLPLAIIQSIAFIYLIRQTVLANNTTLLNAMSLYEWALAVTAMTAGAMLMMYLGELITEQGVGNGISLLIFAGIISQLPATLGSIFSSLFSPENEAAMLHVFNWFTIPIDAVSFYVTLGVTVSSLIILYILVKINEAQRVITINYAKRIKGNSTYSGVKSILPVKLITAGVIPVIFAVAFLALPAFIGQVMQASGDPRYTEIGATLVAWFQTPQPGAFGYGDWTMFIYPAAYFVLVVMFTYFYTGIVFNSNEIAENLQKQGGFVEDIRPGQQTEKYLTRTVNRLTLFGAIALGLIAVTPFVAEYIFAQLGIQATNLAIGGTGILIVVSVALEALRQINSRALMVTYDQY